MKASKFLVACVAASAFLLAASAHEPQSAITLDPTSSSRVSLTIGGPGEMAPPIIGVPPLVCREPVSEILLYVESDRRQVSAIDKDGKFLWHRDPFAVAQSRPYRREFPRIVEIRAYQKPDGKHVSLLYDSSQVGPLDVASGDFHVDMQD